MTLIPALAYSILTAITSVAQQTKKRSLTHTVFFTRKSKNKEANVCVAQTHRSQDIIEKQRSWQELCMYIFCVTLPTIFTNMNISACRACMLFLLQEPLIDQRHQNLVVPQPWSNHSLSYPLPSPFLPLNPQKATPHRVPSRWKKQLPSVGSRWTPSPFPSLLIFLFFLAAALLVF